MRDDWGILPRSVGCGEPSEEEEDLLANASMGIKSLISWVSGLGVGGEGVRQWRACASGDAIASVPPASAGSASAIA